MTRTLLTLAPLIALAAPTSTTGLLIFAMLGAAFFIPRKHEPVPVVIQPRQQTANLHDLQRAHRKGHADANQGRPFAPPQDMDFVAYTDGYVAARRRAA